jgi:hypothetical protein
MIPHEIDKAHLAPGRGDLVIGRADPPFVRPRIANERVVIGIDWIDMAVERVDCPVQRLPSNPAGLAFRSTASILQIAESTSQP